VSEFARIAVVALLFVFAQSPQGTQPPSAQQPPRFRGGTNLVRVDAFATKDGVPVQDLKADDFEIFEENAPQKIGTFEHIVIDAGRPGERIDPASPSQAIQQAGDPHRRVFVIYLDTERVTIAGGPNIKEPLIAFINRAVSDDDLVGVMTPEMGPQQITFGRKTDVIERSLRDNPFWGRADSNMTDDRERLYQQCFPPLPTEGLVSHLAAEMTVRRRERMVLESLHDLTRYMEAIRDGRTAVVTVSDGWVLFKPDPSMTIPRPNDPLPGTPPPVGVGRGGTLTTRPNAAEDVDRTTCDTERHELAIMDDAQYLRDLAGEANRANVSFYTIDPRGLVATECTLCPNIALDRAILKAHHDSLADLATSTDGRFLLESNDLHGQLRQIADDLASYYLMGYYSTNPKLDGRYRTIKVRSKRPGIEVRARQGYRASSAAEVNAARAAADLAIPEEKTAIANALGKIETDARAQSRGRAMTRGTGEPALFHRGPSTGNKLELAAARIFPRSDRVRVELEATPDAPSWIGALLDRTGTKTAVPVPVGERTDGGSGQRWLTADVTLAPLGAGDYIIELTSTAGREQRRTLVAVRVTQ
jgi:VWFA-related protein